MTKQEVFNKVWIPMEKRIPPETKDLIVVANINTGQIWWSVAWQTRKQMMDREKILAGEQVPCQWVTDHHLITHWMKPLPPIK